MTSRYRVEYALKSHRRDQFIEWVKALLAVPFVLQSQPAGIFQHDSDEVARMAADTHQRYSQIMRDVEAMISEYAASEGGGVHPCKLKLLVPSAGPFFTPLPLERAFKLQDQRRFISSRRFVAPSFNDVRLILNTAQVMSVVNNDLRLATFDGDVTLYEDGLNLEASSPVVSRILDLLAKNICVGIVTAAGYAQADGYYTRLYGLLDAVAESAELTPQQKQNLVVMGGEANYLFAMDVDSPHRLRAIPQQEWFTPEMVTWSEDAIKRLLDTAEKSLRDCITNLRLPALLIRKDRAVGIVPSDPSIRIPRESLEETVLVVQKVLDVDGARMAPGIPFCAFNGGRDVFVDIGDKSWGVAVCQRWFGQRNGSEITPIDGQRTLHVGDQFLSAGSNDFKARSVGTTAWIANPGETVDLLNELISLWPESS